LPRTAAAADGTIYARWQEWSLLLGSLLLIFVICTVKGSSSSAFVPNPGSYFGNAPAGAMLRAHKATSPSFSCSLPLAANGSGRLVDVVVQELLNEVDVSEKHATAAVALEAEGVERGVGGLALVKVPQVLLVLVAHDLSAGEATNRDQHGSIRRDESRQL